MFDLECIQGVDGLALIGFVRILKVQRIPAGRPNGSCNFGYDPNPVDDNTLMSALKRYIPSLF